MTLENYKALQSYAVDLLVKSGMAGSGIVDADGSVVVSFLIDEGESQRLASLLRSIPDGVVRDTIVALLESPSIETESKPEATASLYSRRSMQPPPRQ